MIERLKVELAILKDDFEGQFKKNTIVWKPFKYDDSQFQSHTLAKR